MKEVSSSTWIFSLVITFIFLFTCFLTLSISYSKAYKMKNELLTILEKYEGLTADSHVIINNYLEYNGYKTMGKCPIDYYGEDTLKSSPHNINQAETNKNYYYCIQKINEGNNKSNFKIKIFYKFNLPVIGEITTFSVSGTTNSIINHSENLIE